LSEYYIEVANAALGWIGETEGPALNEAVYNAGAAFDLPFLEIGGYAGKSACWIGAAARELDTVLFSVDWHRGSPEMAPGRECHHPEVIGIDGVHDTLPHFRANVRRAGLEQYVIPVAASSHDLAQYWNTQVSFLFIDGDHSEEGVMDDFLSWEGNIVPGGTLALHDYPVISGRAAIVAGQMGYTHTLQTESLLLMEKSA